MQVGRYVLVRRLAVGGMAELFLARTTATHGFEKLVVLKRILPSFAQSAEFTQMFLTEARLAAGLDHPNIAQVFDFGEHDGSYYFTMEYVRGRDLRQIVRAAREKQRALPLGFIVHIITGMLAGLHHAHEHHDAHGNPLRIVHRDISPANALVTYEGDVKLVDFGIAKAAALGPATVTGGIKGKIAYMSPEQCRGAPLDARSDLFSIGTLLWELTMRRRLFGKTTGGNHLSLLRKVDDAVIPRPTELMADYPRWLEAIVLKALQRDPAARFASALEFRVALEDAARETRVPVSSAQASALMLELFPAEEREDLAANSGDLGTLPSVERARRDCARGTAPGDDGTQPRYVSSAPNSTEVVRLAVPRAPQRALVPVVASLGVMFALFGAGITWLSLRTDPAALAPTTSAPAPGDTDKANRAERPPQAKPRPPETTLPSPDGSAPPQPTIATGDPTPATSVADVARPAQQHPLPEGPAQLPRPRDPRDSRPKPAKKIRRSTEDAVARPKPGPSRPDRSQPGPDPDSVGGIFMQPNRNHAPDPGAF